MILGGSCILRVPDVEEPHGELNLLREEGRKGVIGNEGKGVGPCVNVGATLVLTRGEPHQEFNPLPEGHAAKNLLLRILEKETGKEITSTTFALVETGAMHPQIEHHGKLYIDSRPGPEDLGIFRYIFETC